MAPWIVRLPISYEAAVDEVLAKDFVGARKRLLKLLTIMPDPLQDGVPIKLLLARTLLETGEPAAAEALFPAAFRALKQPRHYTNPAESAYLKYAGNQLYERATQRLGHPLSFDIGVEFEDLDLAKISRRKQEAFPVSPPNRAAVKFH